MRFSFLAFSLLLAGSQVLAAPTSTRNSLAEAKATSAQIERTTRGSSARYFADMNTDPQQKSGPWREMRPRKRGENPLIGLRCASSAKVRTRGGKIVWAEIESNSFSGDWMRTARYFFRSDGSLAKLDSTLSTFYTAESAPVIVHDVRYYDASGRVLGATTAYRDGKTGRALKNAKYFPNEAPIYPRISKLPFYALLQKSAR